MKSFLCLFAAFFISLPLFAQKDIVVVDFQTIFKEYRELQEADQAFRGSVEAFKAERQERVDELTEKQAEFTQLRQEAANPETSSGEREKLAEQATGLLTELQTLERALQEEQQQFQNELQAKGNRLRKRITDSVKAKIAELAEERSWKLVIDKSSKGSSGLDIIQYATPDMDVTREVIQYLNQDDGIRNGE